RPDRRQPAPPAPVPPAAATASSASAVELQAAAGGGADQFAPVPHLLAVDPGRVDPRAEGGALERRPAALAEHVLAAHGKRLVADQHQVGPVALAQEAALADVEQLRRRVAGLLH